jgi:hypothetical protein
MLAYWELIWKIIHPKLFGELANTYSADKFFTFIVLHNILSEHWQTVVDL